MSSAESLSSFGFFVAVLGAASDGSSSLRLFEALELLVVLVEMAVSPLLLACCCCCCSAASALILAAV